MIPARYGSTRLEGKALVDIAGKPMIQHVYEQACRATRLDEVIIATDDERIAAAVRAFGGRYEMTSDTHRSGTDRLAEVAGRVDCDLIVNIQGDEPMIEPAAIDAAAEPFFSGEAERFGTIATPITDIREHLEPSTVKVVVDRTGHALYFSRAPLPYFRLDASGDDWPADKPRQHPESGVWPLKHIGLYVYTRETLLWYAALDPTPLEQTEKLEQLRALENGCPIRVVQVDYSPIGVDTPEDLERVRRIFAGAGDGPPREPGRLTE
jgi:3-deoxy-manno-octulosonate cytidylyltransferase (CMP-KDO synthetase)